MAVHGRASRSRWSRRVVVDRRGNLSAMRAFNADFYVTTATVIPVLYLALTLQGRTYHDVVTRWRKVNKDAPFTFWPQAKVIALAITGIGLSSVILYGVYGEYLALHALNARQASSESQGTVLQASILLLAVTAAGPVLWFLGAYFGTLADDFRGAMAGRLGDLLGVRKATATASLGAGPSSDQPPSAQPGDPKAQEEPAGNT